MHVEKTKGFTRFAFTEGSYAHECLYETMSTGIQTLWSPEPASIASHRASAGDCHHHLRNRFGPSG
jgi:hypothetical protein